MVTERSKIEIRKREMLVFLYGSKCQYPNCEETQNLEFAHITPTELNGRGRGQKERIRDIIKNPLSYVLSCNKHNDCFEAIKLACKHDWGNTSFCVNCLSVNNCPVN